MTVSRVIFKRLLPALFLVFLVGVALTWWIGSRLIEPANHAVPLPVGFPAQVVSIQSVGHAVAGWWVDQGSGSPVVLLLHGIRADRSSMVGRAQLLMRHGFSVLLIDLQAHGETPGDAITMGFRESADVVAARDFIRRTYPQRRIGVIGCSMGGAAILLGPQPSGFDAVVLEAVYPRAQRAIENRIRVHLGPLAPLLTPLLTLQIQPRLHVSASALEPIRSIGKLGAPLLVVAGSRDERTTLAESMELFAAATEPKSLWVVDGARHQDFLAYDPRGYDAHVVEFLIETLAPVANAAMPTDIPGGVLRIANGTSSWHDNGTSKNWATNMGNTRSLRPARRVDMSERPIFRRLGAYSAGMRSSTTSPVACGVPHAERGSAVFGHFRRRNREATHRCRNESIVGRDGFSVCSATRQSLPSRVAKQGLVFLIYKLTLNY